MPPSQPPAAAATPTPTPTPTPRPMAGSPQATVRQRGAQAGAAATTTAPARGTRTAGGTAGSHAARPGRSLFSCRNVCCGLLVALIGMIAYPIGRTWMNLQPGQPFALMVSHNGTVNPPSFHSRFRGADYAKATQFFQWWNFLIYDAETNDHWTLVYSIEDYAPTAVPKDTATVGMAHLRGTEKQVNAGFRVPLEQLTISNDFDLSYRNKAGEELHSMTIIDDNTYRLKARFPKADVTFDLTVHRLQGYFGSEDAEKGNIDGLCTMLSTLFSYDSEVEGTITEKGHVFTITRSSRFRSYSAGSWGCQMPHGPDDADPILYPWSWMWLIIPASETNEEFGMVTGTGRFGFGLPIGNIEGGYAALGYGKDHLSARTAQMWHNSSLEIPIQSSASDGFLRLLDVRRDEWTEFTDFAGTAQIPLRQTFVLATKSHRVVIDFHSKINQYFRLPAVVAADDGRIDVFSDFRAVGVRTHVLFQRVDEKGHATTVLDRWVDTMNAVEYAYRAPISVEKITAVTTPEEDQ